MFGKTDAAIRRKIKNTALQTKNARAVMRKSGFVAASVPLPRPRTIIDAFMGPQEVYLARQYAADFTNVTHVRISSQSDIPIYVHYSLSHDSTELNPGDYQVLEGELEDATTAAVGASDSNSSGDLRWFALNGAQRIPLRLTLSTETTEVSVGGLSDPFSVALQAI